ncbi:MAG TPA: TIGR03619 family F420-dependent LLM class oxidoreductase [Chloroflexota bacterium]|nr:TIGR03619 family F420-dependent LLM class oxidoreductase [Chloroflexota bacterium]
MPVKFSTGLPNCREGRQNLIGSVDLGGMLRFARLADDLGYYSLWPNEFFVTFPEVAAKYLEPPNLYDTIVTMSYVAAATRRIRITPSTIVLPLHEPLLLSRQLATLDVFSGGRITLGIGLGGSTNEFRRLHGELRSPHRGQMMDEYVQALRVLWTERKATFRGQYTTFEDVESHPKPVQDPFPIFMAGHAEPVFRRLAAHGQGWIDSAMPPEELGSYAKRFREYAAEAGRGDVPLELARQFYVSMAATEQEAKANHAASVPPPTRAQAGPPPAPRSPQERNLIGTPEFIRNRLAEYVAVGVTELCMIFFSSNGESAERQLRLFAEHVMPAFV